jgi:hypothetical protein
MYTFNNSNTITYDGIAQEKYSIILNGNTVAAMHLDEDCAIEMLEQIKIFIAEKGRNNFDFLEIKNDNDVLGVIVDIWKDDECVSTLCFWFEDFYKD